QSDANRQYLLKRRHPKKKKEKKERKKIAPAKQRQSVQVPEDAKFLDDTDDAGLYWTEANFTYLARAWVTASVQTVGRTKGFTFYQKKNDAHEIYQGLNDDNDFKHHEAYKILAREPRWANLRNDGLNYAENVPKNVARKTSDNSSPGNSVGSNNLSEEPNGQPTPQSASTNSKLNGSLYEGGSRPVG
ncbi:hypothetical protein GIB67_043263, partial [Kingdonia uniflora]